MDRKKNRSFELRGHEALIETVRTERKSGSILLFFPSKLAKKLGLMGSEVLVAVADDTHIVTLFKDSAILSWAKPKILEDRRLFQRMKARARAEQAKRNQSEAHAESRP